MPTQSLVLTTPQTQQELITQRTRRYTFLHSSSWTLWVCLIVSLLVRVWLVIHTHGVIEGDEALVGIQAQHILQGERPVYFYAQPYMGSLEAYIIALLFAIAGSSVWTLRAEPILLSLLLVWLTWCLAGTLTTHLPSYVRQWFRTVAAFFAALPPLYDIVLEMRTYGGYIETLILMLLLLLSAVCLTQRWYKASWYELVLRWSAIGLIVGLGFWVYPLIIIAVMTVSFWITGFCIVESLRPFLQRTWRPQSGVLAILRGLVFLPAAVPTALLGAAPALYWGAANHWENISYLLNNSNVPSQNRLPVIREVTHLYVTCTAPRVIGGAIPTEPYVSVAHPHLLTPSLVVGVLCITIVVGLFALSFVWHRSLLVQVRQLVGLPLLFALCAALVFCTASISANGLGTMCGPKDLVGRYSAPLMLALPFFFATLFTLAVQWLCSQGRRTKYLFEDDTFASAIRKLSRSRVILVRQALVALVLLLFLSVQVFAYTQASPNYLFQTSGCVIAPFNDAPVIDYMEREHIRYAWATSWIGNLITFKTQSHVIVIDPRTVAYSPWYINRIPAYTSAVADAKRASVLLLVPLHEQPPLLKRLAAEYTSYRVAHFSSEPGYELLVITPINHTISPKEISDMGVRSGGC